MQFLTSLSKKSSLMLVLMVAMFATMFTSASMAGTDTTFNSVYTTLDGWLSGSLGKVLATAMVAVGIGIGIAKQSIMAVVLFFGVSLVLVNVSAVIGLLFTATL